MRVAYLTTYDARDPRAWSGLGHFMWRALAGVGIDVELAGPLDVRCPPILLAKRAAARYARGRQYLWERSPRGARAFADAARRALDRLDYDVVLCPDTVPVAHLREDRPIVTWTDATFPSMIGFYPGADETTIAAESIADGVNLDRAATARSARSLYGSDWAAKSALDDLGADPRQVEVVPFGANLEQPPTTADVERAIEERDATGCTLLFLGSDWERKGGPTAVAAVATLRERGHAARLAVVGCAPEIPPAAAPFVDVVGYVDKSRDGAKIASLLASAHFLILPARAECFGLPLCEASAFGVPSVATRVGGVPTVVREGLNGVLLPVDARAEDYADQIERLLGRRDEYQALARTSRIEFETRLNWQTAAGRVKSVLESL
jgi:glycosyltransferase involved in cell wall biosynthesis